MNWLIPLLLLLVLASLAHAMVSMLRGKRGPQMARALTLRVALSLGVFVLIMLGKLAGS